jgi:hypothetical protein
MEYVEMSTSRVGFVHPHDGLILGHSVMIASTKLASV